MFLLSKPGEKLVRQFISAQHAVPFSYSEVGATRNGAVTGYTIDHNRIKLGYGEETYQRAISAIRSWKQFDLGWVSIVPSHTPVDVGHTVAIQAKTFGFWSLSACRIVYVTDEGVPVRKFGFAYGTLQDHVECGEERFTIEWYQSTDNSVWYDIYAFSRPQHALVKLGRPIARKLQKRFARESLVAVAKASQ